MKCCGVESYRDFEQSVMTSSGKKVPDACCIKDASSGIGILLSCPHVPTSENTYKVYPSYDGWGSKLGTTKCGTADISKFQNCEY